MDLTQTVDFHIKATWHSLTKMHNKIALRYDASQTIAYVLIHIEKEGTPATKIAPLLGMEPTSLSRLLKTMETKGLIYKKASETDKRVVRIFLTEMGLVKRQVAKDAVIDFNKKVFDKVKRRDMKTFIEVLNKVNELAKQETP